MEIQTRIKAIREAKRLSQYDMAEKIGVSQSTYLQIEKGKTELTINRLYQICDALGITIDLLLDLKVKKILDDEFMNDTRNQIDKLDKSIEYLTTMIDLYKDKDELIKSKIKKRLQSYIEKLTAFRLIGKVKLTNIRTKEEQIFNYPDWQLFVNNTMKVDIDKAESFFNPEKFKLDRIYNPSESENMKEVKILEETLMKELYMLQSIGILNTTFIDEIVTMFESNIQK